MTITRTRTTLRMHDILVMSRPRFWLASVAMMELGFVLATHRVLPRGPELVTLAHALVVTGPLLWLAILAVNDAYDLETDRVNQRKAKSPLVNGRVTPRTALQISAAASVSAVVAAVPLGSLFTIGTAFAVLLGWAYSTPPLRLKARAGADLAANAIAGLIGPLGGWVAITRTMEGFPWPIAVIGVMAAAALYLPTTLVDHDADHHTGIRTTAVALGRRATFELGFAFWAGSAVLTFVLIASGTVIDESLLPLHLLLTPVLLVLYRVLLKDRPTFPAITVLACAYLVPCAAFALTYVEAI